MWKTLAGGAPSPNEDILINVEVFRGSVSKGDWKFLKVALLPGKTEFYNLAKDPAATTNVAAQGKSIMDPDFGIDDGGLPHEKQKIPRH